MKITLDQFIAHWTKGNHAQPFVSHFERAIFDFTTQAGDYTRQRFKSSFASKYFVGAGSAWKPRRSKWGTIVHKHPLMRDKGILSAESKTIGILKKQPPMSHTFLEQAPSPKHRSIYRKGSYYHIYTNAKGKAEHKKRGANPHSNQSYAAVHNTDPKFGLYKVNQRPGAGQPEHRQFIGFHPTIDEHIRGLIPDIFDEFPLH